MALVGVGAREPAVRVAGKAPPPPTPANTHTPVCVRGSKRSLEPAPGRDKVTAEGWRGSGEGGSADEQGPWKQRGEQGSGPEDTARGWSGAGVADRARRGADPPPPWAELASPPGPWLAGARPGLGRALGMARATPHLAPWPTRPCVRASVFQEELPEPFEHLLQRIARRPKPQQFFGLMGKRDAGHGQISHKRHKTDSFVGLMGKRALNSVAYERSAMQNYERRRK
uniref:Protachykinin-1 n=1 Tax=Oryctolagus cuniculus TaxID=9986 RepID=A0A5F9DQL1_RABIT